MQESSLQNAAKGIQAEVQVADTEAAGEPAEAQADRAPVEKLPADTQAEA